MSGQRNGVDALARSKWTSSGLTDEQADLLKLKPLAPRETLAAGCLEAYSVKIPYFDLNGKLTEFFRVRYLGRLPGTNGLLAKPPRYAQPKGSLNEVYMPPVLERTWGDIAADPGVGLLITEGEFKAAAASVRGIPTLGLGGVDMWRSTRRGLPVLPALEKFEWQGRSAVIVYDSDAAVNPNVVRAQRQLAGVLAERGALVKIASLPAADDGAKQGLDDYLVAQGVEALKEVIKEAQVLSESAALWEMNEEVMYVKNPGLIIVREDGRKISPAQFTQHAFSNRHYVEVSLRADGSPVGKRKPLAPRWLEWERRFEVERLVYLPGRDEIVDGKWNTWPGWGVAPKKGDVGPWHWLLDFLFKSDPAQRKWFEQWCAYPLQRPGAKLYTTAVLWGLAKGTGKSMAAYALKAIYGTNGVEIKNKHLKKDFNAWQIDKQFVILDEITGGDKRVDADYIKGLITQPEIHVNQKYIPEYTIDDVINYIANSNHPDAFFIEDHERRFFVHEVVGKPAEQHHYDKLDVWLHGDGPAALFDYLLKLNLTGFNPKGHAPVTRAARAMAMAGKSDIAYWCVRLAEDTAGVLAILGEAAAKDCDTFTAGQLLKAYDPEGRGRVTPSGMARELRRAGFVQLNGDVPIRTATGIHRLWAIRNGTSWIGRPLTKVAEHFNQFFGPKKDKTK